MSLPLTSATSAPEVPTVGAIGKVERLLLISGIVLFAVLLYHIGLEAVWRNLQLIGWGFALVFAQEAFAFLFTTLGWRSSFAPPAPAVSLWMLAKGRIAGDAISNLTPTATVGGELIRARMLDGQVEPSVAWASVVIAKLAQAASQMVFILVGFLIVGGDTPLPGSIRKALYIGLTLIITGLTITLLLQRRGLFGAISRLAGRLGFTVPSHIALQLQLLDQEISRFHTNPAQFARSVGFFFAAWLMPVVETYLLLIFLQVEASMRLALTIEVLATAIDAILFLVPARAGIQEGGKVLIFSILGLDTAKGLALGIARRIRELGWGLVGLLILARHQARTAP